ncbi:MAG TPA: hypothetical protein DIU00_12575 [Phycisphaerales bacterium]|nr:hypothetical protein [Phycisphaerales bacterium]
MVVNARGRLNTDFAGMTARIGQFEYIRKNPSVVLHSGITGWQSKSKAERLFMVYFPPIIIFFSFSIPLGTPYGEAIESLADRLPILWGLQGYF